MGMSREVKCRPTVTVTSAITMYDISSALIEQPTSASVHHLDQAQPETRALGAN